MFAKQAFVQLFSQRVILWKRFIDDVFGIFHGSPSEFTFFFGFVQSHFEEFGLELTHEFSKTNLAFLDVNVYLKRSVSPVELHTSEYRKPTSAETYLTFGSAHATHTFRGIVKSQMIRLRRLHSEMSLFLDSIESLRTRCLNSGYDPEMVNGILISVFLFVDVPKTKSNLSC